MTTIIDLAETLGITPADVVALAEQLADIDGTDAVYTGQHDDRTFDTRSYANCANSFLAASAVEHITDAARARILDESEDLQLYRRNADGTWTCYDTSSDPLTIDIVSDLESACREWLSNIDMDAGEWYCKLVDVRGATVVDGPVVTLTEVSPQ